MRFVQRVANNRPILISGDFNAEPIEPVYSTVINYTPLRLSSAYADLLASISNQNGTESKESEPETADENSSDGVENGMKSRVDHLINHEPPYTTWKIREDGEVCHTIDYVFYSKDKLKVSNPLKMLSQSIHQIPLCFDTFNRLVSHFLDQQLFAVSTWQ